MSMGLRLKYYKASLLNLGVAGAFQRRRASRQGNCTIAGRYSAHPMFVRQGTSDMSVFDQIFVDREYRCLDGLTNVKNIIDAGANVGYSSAYLLTRFPEARVVALEPDAGNFSALQRNLEPWAEKVTALNGALWSEVTKLNLVGDTPGNEWGRQVVADEGGAVQAFDVPALMQKHAMEVVDLLKIDIEGAEQAVFAAPNLEWLDRVRNIVIELHGEECSATFHSAIARSGYSISRCDELTVCLRHEEAAAH